MQWIVCFLFIYAFILRLNNIKSQLYNLTSKRICLRFYLCIFNRSLCSVGKSLMIHAHVCRRDVPSPAVPWISSARWRRLAIRSSCSMPLAWTRAAAQWPLASKWIPFSLSVICQLIRIVLFAAAAKPRASLTNAWRITLTGIVHPMVTLRVPR